MGLSAVGLVLGLAAAIALGRFIQGQLFGIAFVDPITFGGVPLLLGVSAGLACFIPARRATKLNPASTLRES